MVSAAEIAAMQATCQTTMTTACTISRVTRVSDGMGGVAETWATHATTVCLVAPYKRLDAEVPAEERLLLADRWVIHLPAGTDVNAKDRIVAQGITYEVSRVAGPRTVELTRDCLCYEVQ